MRAARDAPKRERARRDAARRLRHARTSDVARRARACEESRVPAISVLGAALGKVSSLTPRLASPSQCSRARRTPPPPSCRRFLSRSRSPRTRSCRSECARPPAPAPTSAPARPPPPPARRSSRPLTSSRSSSSPAPSPRQAERPGGGPVHRGAQVRRRGVQGARGDQRHHHERCVSDERRASISPGAPRDEKPPLARPTVRREPVVIRRRRAHLPADPRPPHVSQTASASTPARRAGTCSSSTAASSG